MNQYVDTWNPGTCSQEALLAYKALESAGTIKIERVVFLRRTGQLKICYASAMAHGEILTMLKAKKTELAA